MPLLTTIRSFFGSHSKSEPPSYAASQMAAFTAGIQYAWGPAGQAFRDQVYEQALDEALKQLEPTIVRRAEEAGTVQARVIVDLQTKQRDFESKLAATKDPKYQYYLEALNWMLPTNGH